MEKNKAKILIVVALLALAFLIVGATYAYFTAQIGDGKRAEINVTTYTTDVFTFATGDAINLETDQTTFGKDKGSVNGTTYASALLTANNKTNNAVEHYYLYLNIENNTFTYSVQDNKPELIMTITDKDGNEVKNIEGLTYTEVTDRTNKKISGYDITTKSGLVTIFNNREIIAEPKAEDKWNITITFVNYEADQNANTGKVLSAKLMIQKNEYKTLVDYVKSQFTGVQGENYLYHHDGTLENGINDNSYRYAGESAQPGYYSCKYKGTDVSNVDGELNKSLKGDCDSVSMVYRAEYGYVDKSITKVFTDKTTVKWDNANNKCVTTNGEEVILNDGKALPQSLCNGYAYKVVTPEGESLWGGGIKIEELGPGVETLFTPEDKENQKPALYSCKYNGIDVLNLENGNINSSLKGDCSSVFKYSFMVNNDMYIDKSLDKAIANKQAVKWDSANNKCVTSTGADVSIDLEEDCTGDAYFIRGNWLGNVVIENMGAGVESEGVKNYVCFGSNESPCPTDNLYRIIGVFDHKISETKTEQRVKLIKYDYATSDLLGTDGDYRGGYIYGSSHYKGSNFENIAVYYWNRATRKNTWSESNLNKVNLNINFINNIGKEWADKIVETTWKVGGNTRENIYTVIPSVAYQNEILNPMSNTTDSKTEYNAKIGLMYVSDYVFAADPSEWTTELVFYDISGEKNWMDMGLTEWTITRYADDSDHAFEADVQYGIVYDDYEYFRDGVRPSFSLLPSISYKSGSGTFTDPIRIG